VVRGGCDKSLLQDVNINIAAKSNTQICRFFINDNPPINNTSGGDLQVNSILRSSDLCYDSR